MTEDATTAPSSATKLAGVGSWESLAGAAAPGIGSTATPSGAAAPGVGSTAPSATCRRTCSRKEVMNSVEGGAAPAGDGSVPTPSGASPGGWTVLSVGEGSMPARGYFEYFGGACEVRRAVIGGAVVCCSCWCAMWGPGGRAPPPTGATSGPRGEGVPLAEGRGDVGVRGRGAALSLSPALSRGDAIRCCYWGAGGVVPPACHGGARRGRLSAGVRSEQPERGGSVARRETHQRLGQGMGVRAVATTSVITTRAHRTTSVRVESERCEGCRRRARPSSTERRGACGLGTARR